KAFRIVPGNTFNQCAAKVKIKRNSVFEVHLKRRQQPPSIRLSPRTPEPEDVTHALAIFVTVRHQVLVRMMQQGEAKLAVCLWEGRGVLYNAHAAPLKRVCPGQGKRWQVKLTLPCLFAPDRPLLQHRLDSFI